MPFNEGIVMKHHTIVCGTSKSKEIDAYYIGDQLEEKFWGSLYEADITENDIGPRDYRELGKKYGIYLTEIVDRDKYIIKSDKKIELYHLKDGFPKLFETIENEKPKRILFNGKRAADWFWQWTKFNEIKILSEDYAIMKKCYDMNYGLQRQHDWNFDAEIYVLPNNTSGSASHHWKRNRGEERWIKAWKACSQDCKNHQRENP